MAILCILRVRVLSAPRHVQAEVGVTEDKILFGSFQDMSGPGAYLGKQVSFRTGRLEEMGQ